MEEIGIFGGTFNPVHKAHINLAVEAKKEFGLDEVWFMPTLKSPHKDNKYITDISTRMDMRVMNTLAVPTLNCVYQVR